MTDHPTDYEYGRAQGIIAYTQHATREEKLAVKIGVLPYRIAEELGVTGSNSEISRGFAVGMMDCAKEDGGMVA